MTSTTTTAAATTAASAPTTDVTPAPTLVRRGSRRRRAARPGGRRSGGRRSSSGSMKQLITRTRTVSGTTGSGSRAKTLPAETWRGAVGGRQVSQGEDVVHHAGAAFVGVAALGVGHQHRAGRAVAGVAAGQHLGGDRVLQPERGRLAQGLGVAGAQAEHRAQVGGGQAVAQRQFEDLAVGVRAGRGRRARRRRRGPLRARPGDRHCRLRPHSARASASSHT